MRRLLGLWVANFGNFRRERDDSRVQKDEFLSQGVQLGLLPEDDLAELLEVVLQMRQQQFDARESVVRIGVGHRSSDFKFKFVVAQTMISGTWRAEFVSGQTCSRIPSLALVKVRPKFGESIRAMSGCCGCLASGHC